MLYKLTFLRENLIVIVFVSYDLHVESERSLQSTKYRVEGGATVLSSITFTRGMAVIVTQNGARFMASTLFRTCSVLKARGNHVVERTAH